MLLQLLHFALSAVKNKMNKAQEGLNKWINSDIFLATSSGTSDKNKWTPNKCGVTVHPIIYALRYLGVGASDKKSRQTDGQTDGPTDQHKHRQLS